LESYVCDEIDMPNLSYASEKFRYAFEAIHAAYAETGRLRAAVPSAYAECPPDAPPINPTCSTVQWELRQAFRQLLVGICEIHGMLDVLNIGEDAIISKLLAFSREELKEWIDRFEHNGQLAVDRWQH
jgi:hypothetical protein